MSAPAQAPVDDGAQRLAADPGLSAFVSANAGSGKTKTLIDRVARLLLVGARPETILCVTYTKAAAAEMQRRLFSLLGDWSIWDDGKLRDTLATLEGETPDAYGAERLSRARGLFARALETPGGLKIQTIHAFCEKLLRRFPLEAGVSPGFKVMDDAASAAISDAARKMVARHALAGEGAVAEAYARFSVQLDFQAFQTMFGAFEARRAALTAYLDGAGGLAGAIADVWTVCGFDDARDPETIAREAMADLDRDLFRAVAEVLEAGGTGAKEAKALRAIAASPDLEFGTVLRALFIGDGEGTPATWVTRSKSLSARPELQMALLSAQDRLAAARARMRAATVAWDTAYALALAQAYLEAFEIEKRSLGALDFADLIDRTAALVSASPMAAWVLFKLDGGVDHILLDEAQDTAPGQWAVLDAIVDEFFSGDAIERPRQRNMFVVGDEKQSIYSFQGADPTLLKAKFHRHRDRAQAALHRFEQVDLLASWRSTEEILSFVDVVFSGEETRLGVPPPEGAERVRHVPMRLGHQGCVDIWPLAVQPEAARREAWDTPLDVEPEQSAVRQLAANIACEIEATIQRGDAVFDRTLKANDGSPGDWRPARYSDVLILVRKRGPLFEEILRALKHNKVPVAGADRLALSEHIVFDDLMALARFCLFPDDDLTLAALLRSPFCTVEDDSLYALAHRRPSTLWEALRDRAAERPEWTEAVEVLGQALALARTQRPFEFYSHVLGFRSLRARLLRRLGNEAEDALDEFLSQVLSAEGRGVEDLESLTAAFAGLDITVKREMEAVRNEVRVMTAHGAKGLEASIVFLPETTGQGAGRDTPLLPTEAGGFLWASSRKADCEASAAARDRRAQAEADEAWRLLYVALTRARERLVLCGKLPGNRKEENLKGWWGLLKPAFDAAEIAPHTRQIACGDLQIQRFGPDPAVLGRGQVTPPPVSPLPVWASLNADAEAYGRYASPSDLGEDTTTPAASPLAPMGGLGRFRRGDLIHRLLQILPDLAPAARGAGARSLLARERDLSEAQRAEMAGAALAVLEDIRFAEVFGPGSRAEVAIAGSAAGLPPGLKISGRIDRLVVLPDRVLVADFKTNRPSPARIEDADPAYLRQMAIYAAVLAEVFPGCRIEAALVWTDGPKLMPIPENLIRASLADLGRGG